MHIWWCKKSPNVLYKYIIKVLSKNKNILWQDY